MNQSAPNKKLIILTPVFEDKVSFACLLNEIAIELDGAYVIAIEDGSIRAPIETADFVTSGLSGEIIYLSRNIGHQKAIALGVTYVSKIFENYNLVIMDSDGEDMPSSIQFLRDELAVGFVSAVLARRASRHASNTFKLFYFLYRRLFKMLSGRVINFGNFMILNEFAVKRLSKMHELWVHIAGAMLLSKIPSKSISLKRGPRYSGVSKMNFTSLVLHGLRGVIVFSDDVLVRVVIFSAFLTSISLLSMPILLLLKSFGLTTPGWASTLFGISFLIFMQSGILALVTLLGGSAKYFDLRLPDIDQLIDRVVKIN